MFDHESFKMFFKIELEFRGGAKFCIMVSVSRIGCIGAGDKTAAGVDGVVVVEG